ncbi:MAG: hypothetical protein AAGJ31_11250 [Verrucomicrobiota bacterium]
MEESADLLSLDAEDATFSEGMPRANLGSELKKVFVPPVMKLLGDESF